MNSMNFIVWMLPIIFMLHDFEEIIMAEVWGKRYEKEINKTWPNKQPFGLNYIKTCHTPTFSIGVEVIFLIGSVISFFSVMFQNYFLWYGSFLGITLHFVFVHMLGTLKFKHYVPGVITSFIFLIPSIWFLYAAEKILHFNTLTILLALLFGILLTIFLILYLHKLMGSWSKTLDKYSNNI